jgi:hypothetical protein
MKSPEWYRDYVQPLSSVFKFFRTSPVRLAAYITSMGYSYDLYWDTREQANVVEPGMGDYAAHIGNLPHSIMGSYIGGLLLANLMPKSVQERPRRVLAAAVAGAAVTALALNALVETKTGQSILQDAPEWIPTSGFDKDPGTPEPADALYGVAAGTATAALVYTGSRWAGFEDYADDDYASRHALGSDNSYID